MKPYITSIPYYKDNILDMFANFSKLPWSVLLYSGKYKKKENRYDIFSSLPSSTILTYGKLTKINRLKNKKKFFSLEDPLFLLEKEISYYDMNYIDYENFPFQGGAIGIFGYDLSRRFIILNSMSKKDTNFPDMAVGIYEWVIISDNKNLKTFLISQNEPSLILEKLKKKKIKYFFYTLKKWKANLSKFQYNNCFENIQEHLKKGDCYQVCLSQRFSNYYIGNEWSIFCKLLKFNLSFFSAFFRLPINVVLSFSPEQFLFVKNNKIITKPIKGTIKRYKCKKKDKIQKNKLINSDKDKAENLMIVDLLRNDLGKVSEKGSVKVKKLFEIESFYKIHHMVSTITAKLDKNKTIFDLIRSCFPGGSITGAPKISAMKIIEKTENIRRNFWCGSIFYISCCSRMDSNILIRTILTENNKIYYYSGSGITIYSEKDLEFQEIINKTLSVIPFIEML
ncbi:MAG: aminodeoxychorismate synthase component I [Enterobacteriaceae bacterium]